ncbi:hypothetical protein TUSST3_27380 [Streptomyces sp. TUS-ST3]|nr:hypothetical protein TUSST3_27380 [Streptomyces sp. TUS-ST3]
MGDSVTQAARNLDQDDVEAMAVYDAALADFTDALNRLHIEFGAPSYSQIVKASERPKLSRAGINEVLSGKRLASLDALIEFVRVVTNSGSQNHSATPGHATHPERVSEWRQRWREVKYLQREVQASARRIRRATTTLIAEALAEAESVRAQAHEQAEAIRQDASAQADHVFAQAREDALALKQQAAELRARAEREVGELHRQAQNESAQVRQDANKRAEEILRAANDRLTEAEARAQEIVQHAKTSRGWPPAAEKAEALRELRNAVRDSARKALPALIKTLSERGPQGADVTVKSVGTFSDEEVDQIAQAFDAVHREAVRLAVDQALLRGNVNTMIADLSRRSRSHIQRQLSIISELESREEDPDQLSSLFELDHVTTRLRRDSESAMALAGERTGVGWTRPVPLVDVLRAAASEVEQYQRIELVSLPTVEVAGSSVNDLVHLLAELLENALSFSSPPAVVKGTGHALPDGRVLIEIHDTGVGLSPEDLAAINERLASPPAQDVSVFRHMGLHVVSRLSQRQGISVQLRPSDSEGTIALVMLPADGLVKPESADPEPTQ